VKSGDDIYRFHYKSSERALEVIEELRHAIFKQKKVMHYFQGKLLKDCTEEDFEFVRENVYAKPYFENIDRELERYKKRYTDYNVMQMYFSKDYNEQSIYDSWHARWKQDVNTARGRLEKSEFFYWENVLGYLIFEMPTEDNYVCF